MQCETAPHGTNRLVWEGAQIGGVSLARGVACPQAGDAKAESIATAAMTKTSAEWWRALNDHLASTLNEEAG
jgi:hypothetical protein